METITTNIKKINVNGIIWVPIESFSKDGVSFSCGSISISNNNLINSLYILYDEYIDTLWKDFTLLNITK